MLSNFCKLIDLPGMDESILRSAMCGLSEWTDIYLSLPKKFYTVMDKKRII